MIPGNHSDLHKRGWLLTETSGDEELLELATSLGVPVPSRKASPLIDELRPLSRSQARPFSLSAQHGTGAFPLHTDTAHWSTPARYVVLRAARAHDRATLLVDSRSLPLDADGRKLLKRAVFTVRSGRGSFLTTIQPEDEKFFRFDRGCMFPKTASASYALSLITSAEASCPLVEIDWLANSTLVLDNWRFLHGRAHGDGTNKYSRLLRRVLVAEKI